MRFLEHRIPPPLVAVLFAALMWFIARMTPVLDIPDGWRWGLTGLFLLDGLVLCIAGVLSFHRAKTTVNPLKPETATALVRSGIYRVTRNPMYLGFVALLLAWNMSLAAPWALLGVVGFMGYLTRFQIVPEERALSALFGDAFRDYQTQVRRWL
jgi:protein-S-isoprenylcysteine O-methyltransferase Ste14